MKALAINKFGDSNVFELVDLNKPEIKPDEILIETKSGSVNPIDCKQRKGNHRFIFGSPFPIVLGYDVAGIVIETGDAVENFKTGDKVCGVLNNKYGGGLAAFAKGNKTCFAKVSDDMDHIKTAVLPMAGLTALQAMRDKANLKSSDKLLIIGAAGGVGHFTLQIANILKADTTVVSSEKHRPFLEKIGFNSFIDYHHTDILNTTEQYHIIFDTIGKYNFRQCCHLLKPNGIYINILPRPKILLHKLFSLFTKGKKVKTLLMKHSSSDLEKLLEWTKEGKIKLMIDKEFSVTDISKAHKYSEEGHTEGKILIRYDW